jgi:hypothetical protein
MHAWKNMTSHMNGFTMLTRQAFFTTRCQIDFTLIRTTKIFEELNK